MPTESSSDIVSPHCEAKALVPLLRRGHTVADIVNLIRLDETNERALAQIGLPRDVLAAAIIRRRAIETEFVRICTQRGIE